MVTGVTKVTVGASDWDFPRAPLQEPREELGTVPPQCDGASSGGTLGAFWPEPPADGEEVFHRLSWSGPFSKRGGGWR